MIIFITFIFPICYKYHSCVFAATGVFVLMSVLKHKTTGFSSEIRDNPNLEHNYPQEFQIKDYISIYGNTRCILHGNQMANLLKNKIMQAVEIL